MSPATLLQLRVHRIHSNSGNSPGGGHPFTFMDAEHLSTPLPAHRINHSSRPSGATFYVERNHRWDTASAALVIITTPSEDRHFHTHQLLWVAFHVELRRSHVSEPSGVWQMSRWRRNSPKLLNQSRL